QAVFARHLNVTTGLVSQWERGEKRPRGASLKLLTLVAKNGLGAVA
ncbi:MAG: transcriptional regulator, partial [Chloroflexi bacterium]|nr:transcriptional regulator [Chloroflexota bacterium]